MGALFALCLRSRWVSLAAAAVVVVSVALPPKTGFGIPLCQFRLVTHLPCLGCGLTRSFIDMAHWNFGRAAFYHPAGVVLFPLVLGLAALLVAPTRIRLRMAQWAEQRGRALTYATYVLVALFVIYGLGRIVWLLVTRQPSPW